MAKNMLLHTSPLTEAKHPDAIEGVGVPYAFGIKLLLFFEVQQYMATTILPIARLVMFHAKRTFLTIRDNGYLLGTDPHVAEIAACTLRALVTKHHIVIRSAPFIAVPLNFQNGTRMLLQPLRIMVQRLHPRVRQGPFIVSKEDVLQASFHCSLFCSPFFFRQFCTMPNAGISWGDRSDSSTLRKVFVRGVL